MEKYTNAGKKGIRDEISSIYFTLPRWPQKLAQQDKKEDR